MKRTLESLKSTGKESNGSSPKNGVASKQEALGVLVRGCWSRAYQFACRLCGDENEAKDLVQEALYRVVREWERYDTSRPFDAWVFTILRNVFLDTRRRYERGHAVSLDAPLNNDYEAESYGNIIPDGCMGVLERLERKETAQAVRQALEGLNEEHRTVLKLRDMEGLRYDEIADVLGLAPGTVRSRILRARRSFRISSGLEASVC